MKMRFDAVQRWRSVACLAIAAGMIHWGGFILQPLLHGWRGLLYWGTCLSFAVASIVFALLDMVIARRHLRRKQALLIRRVDRAIKVTPPAPSSRPPPS